MTLTERVLTLTQRGHDFAEIGALLNLTPAQVEEAWSGTALGGKAVTDPNSSAWIHAGADSSAVAASATHIYWGREASNAIGRAKIDGTEADPEWLKLGEDIFGVALDATHLYWGTEQGIGRAKLDGTEVEPEWVVGGEATDVQTDAGHIYWTAKGAIGRAKLDGTEVEPEWIKDPMLQIGDGVGVSGTHVYWTGGPAPRSRLARAKIDGTEVMPNWALPTSVAGARWVTVDAIFAYWTSSSTGFIGRITLDGVTVEPEWLFVGKEARGLTVNAGYLYWANELTQSIGRLKLGV